MSYKNQLLKQYAGGKEYTNLIRKIKPCRNDATEQTSEEQKNKPITLAPDRRLSKVPQKKNITSEIKVKTLEERIEKLEEQMKNIMQIINKSDPETIEEN